MKSKTPLALMEQIIMVLVFALAAALCLRAFVLSGEISRGTEERDRAILAVQTTAETLKHYRGDCAGTERIVEAALDKVDVVFYHSDHAEKIPGALRVVITPAVSETELLETAEITAETEDGDIIVSLTVAWQGVGEHG